MSNIASGRQIPAAHTLARLTQAELGAQLDVAPGRFHTKLEEQRQQTEQYSQR
jgi:hypothetical protein